MLTLYRRHSKADPTGKGGCPHEDDPYFKRCKCPMWMRGVHEGVKHKESLKTRSWERAEEKKRAIEQGQPKRKTIAVIEATGAYLSDCAARNLSKNSQDKLKLVLGQLEDQFKTDFLKEVNFERLLKFRASWEGSDITKSKKLERLKQFFRWCHDAGWMPTNPARNLKPPRVRITPKDPYSDEELKRIDERLAKCANQKLPVFEKALRHSALRISDVAMLTPEHLAGNKIFLNTQKTGKHVGIPIPPSLAHSLRALPLSGGYFFLHGNSTRRDTQTDYWRDELNVIFKEAEVPRAHPHRYRANAAVRWLTAGLTIEEVAAYLGNSVKIVEKHYLSWSQSRSARAEKILESTWDEPKLLRVK